MKKIAALVVLVAASGGLAGTSWATPRKPTGWTGACNMMIAWPGADHGVAVGIQGDTGGMETAMTADTQRANDNMQYKAVANSNGGDASAC